MKKEEERKMQMPKIDELEHFIEEAKDWFGAKDPSNPPTLYLAWWRVPGEMSHGRPRIRLSNVCGKSRVSPEAAVEELVYLTRLQGYAS